MKKGLLTFLLIGFFFTPMFFARAEGPTPPLAGQVKILLVPGHDNEIWGAQYGNIKEADMNRVLAWKLYDLLKKDKRFEVYITRDENGYTKEFVDYFKNEREAILAFRDEAKKETQNKIEDGGFIEKENVFHNTVTENTAVILYGINKWANEHNIDAVIHVHFNDYPRPTSWTKGKYKGFAIYVPDTQFANGRDSTLLGANIHTELNKKYVVSTYPKELGGLVADQKLIALGSNGTLLSSVRSVLVEYGYIYRFGNTIMRRQSYNEMARLTLAGLRNYFFNK
jgi:N-acetylmuramoyl-L-alanine amidase